MAPKMLALFGGPTRPWDQDDWTSSDDRVRGGKSVSSMRVDGSFGAFFGHLDIDTLGGAGFASQRTTAPDLGFDLSSYDGLQLEVVPCDQKEWTLILKDQVSPTAPTGPDPASISWESSFSMQPEVQDHSPVLLRFAWDQFKPTYRGKEQKHVKPLDLASIKRMSLMVRSFFGSQKGSFCLKVQTIKAYRDSDNRTMPVCSDDAHSLYSTSSDIANEKVAVPQRQAKTPRARGCLCGFL